MQVLQSTAFLSYLFNVRYLNITKGTGTGALLIADGAIVIDGPKQVVFGTASPQVAAQVPPGHELEQEAHGLADSAHTQ